jgi:phosphate-selective porin OprO and OprP
MTQYLKLMLDWQHSNFNQPTLFAPHRLSSVNDLFMVRLQLFF